VAVGGGGGQQVLLDRIDGGACVPAARRAVYAILRR